MIEVIESLDQGIAIYDEEDRPIYCNEAYRTMIGAIRTPGPVGPRRVGANRWVKLDYCHTPGGLTVVFTRDALPLSIEEKPGAAPVPLPATVHAFPRSATKIMERAAAAGR